MSPVTEHAGNAFVTRVARDLVGELAEAGRPVRFLIRARDTKFTGRFRRGLPVGRYMCHYNGQRPHRGIGLGVPAGGAAPKGRAGLAVHRYDVLGGLIHEYRPVAA